ncbi:hypothetical protein EXIGLDRAFT_773803 [Exidia glandulosa HHB12029]|uniref:ARM repeat-containing protein n=1 Tax=Exidia glandulosa HHB12029 TaxID=1314781 RepID=A0A165EMK0_EXIGL|nr:hypothetical protein EXIGLDRAFT_773803 [Exidia glandulosa HHB12029]
MDPEETSALEPPRKRFRHQSYKSALQDVHLPSAVKATSLDDDLEDNSTHLHAQIERVVQVNLSPTFVTFVSRVLDKSRSLPLLLLHVDDVVDAWVTAVSDSEKEDDGLAVLLELLPALLHDLRSALQKHFDVLLSALLAVLPRNHVSPRALTAALAALTSMFRLLLTADMVQGAYTALLAVLRRCNPEVQAAGAEVWAAVLRKLKAAAVRVTLEDIEDDVVAHAFCCACQSVSTSLHTSAPTLVTQLLDTYSTSPSDALFKLLRRLVTALTHYCDTPLLRDGVVVKPSGFAPIADALIEHAARTQNVDVVAWAVGVRKGSRWTKEQLVTLVNTGLAASNVKLASALVLASDMSAFNAVARPVLDSSFNHDVSHGLRVCAAVTGWTGWKGVALGIFTKRVQDLFTAPTDEAKHLALSVLADLSDRSPSSSDTGFWDTVGSYVERNCDQLDLPTVLKLTPILARLAPHLARRVDALLDDEEADGWTLGAVLCALGRSEYDGRADDVKRWAGVVLREDVKGSRWMRDEWTMDGLAMLLEACGATAPTVDLTDALRSHKRRLRLAALRLLPADAVQRHMLAAENEPLDVSGSRGRAVRVTKLPSLVGETSLPVALAWLLGQLKVNLRPIWDPTVKALAELASRFSEDVWDAVWAQLDCPPAAEDVVAEDAVDEVEEMEKETERTWRDPTAFALDACVRRWENYEVGAKVDLQKARRTTDRLDSANYEIQLLRVLTLLPSLAEKHSRLLAPKFLSLLSAGTKSKLGPWLSLFSKFANPKALYRSAELYTAYLALLAHPDRALQKDALACVMKFGYPSIARLEDNLRGLLDETKWRDEMASMASSVGEMGLDAQAEEVMVRVCYGLMTERRAGKERRAAALTLLGASGERALGVLVDLMLQPFGELTLDGEAKEDLKAGEKQQLGFLAMLGDVLQSLGSSTGRYWDRLVTATVRFVDAAQRKIDDSVKIANAEDDKEEDEEKEDVADDSSVGALRAVRQAGLKRLATFFRFPAQTFDFAPYLRFAFASFISPRLPLLDRENTQAPSALLQMFVTWTEQPETIFFLVEFDDRVLPKMYDLLGAASVKPTVIARVLDVADRILDMSADPESEEVAQRVLVPHVGALLANLSILVTRSSVKGTLNDLAQRQISILSRVAQHVKDPQQASTLLHLFAPLLKRPPRVVGERVKTDLLKICVELVPLVPDLGDRSSAAYLKMYELFAGLFSSLRLRSARTAAAAAFQRLSQADISERAAQVAQLIVALNAFSVKRMEEPDFEARLGAYKMLNEELHAQLSAHEWLPIFHNLLFFIQDTEELSLRQNSAYGLRRFIDRVASNEQEILLLFTRVVYPALKRSLRSQSEMVRAEVLGVIAYGVDKCDNVASLKEMRGLLAGGDEEANFFNNICHIQIHRRSRALRRLSEYVETGVVANATLAQIFLPLLGHPIYNSGTTDHLLVNEAITTTGIVAKHLSWVSYYALVQQYQKMIKEPKEKVPVKPLVRALVAVLDNFHFPMEAPVGEAETRQAAGDDAEEDEAPAEIWKADSRIMDAVSVKLLPSLLNILENREDTEDGLRIPITIGIVRIALFLPEAQRRPQVSRLLTVVSQIFRSKSQDTRDLTRETLCKIVVMLGPEYLAETMKQLRGALLRGPHLHILAFVTHAILVHVTTNAPEQFSDLDAAVADIVHVAAEVIFGQSGKDVLSEDFKTKLKEVRGSSSRGLDTFALVSKCVSPAKLAALLLPVRTIMEETESAKVMVQVDDVLRRVASGLNSNPRLNPAELLVMCHTLVSQNAKFLTQTAEPSKKRDKIHRDVEVKIKRTADAPTSHYVNNSHRFIALGLDVFVTAARRSKFNLQDTDTVSRLEPMVNVIGNTLYSRNANVLVLALKAAAAVVKYPLKNVDKALPVFVRQMLDIIKQGGTTESEVAQTALKTLATVMRDRTSSQVREKDLTFLLDLLGPDLEEHERQASVFAILRAIVSRKFIVPEIYDMMDRVAQVMVTSQSPQVQELCRGVLLQFYLDYPQGKGRLQKQMNFLAKNLSYVFESGRKSVMELLGAVLAKFDPALMNEYATLFFVALVMVMANDDSPTCREMAAQLVKTLFQVLDEQRRSELVTLLQSWSTQSTKPQLVRVSIQVLGVVIDTLKEDASMYVPLISSVLRSGIDGQAERLAQAETSPDSLVDLDWQLPYQLLTVLAKLLRTFPAFTPSSEKVPWSSVVELLLFPHAWVRTASARLLGVLFATQPPIAPNARLPESHPLSASGMAEVARKSCLQLRGETLDAQLSVQVTKNLVYIAKCYCHVSEAADAKDDSDADQSDEEESEKGDGEDGDGADEKENGNAEQSRPTGQLNWLFSRLSHQARGAVVARRSRKSTAENWTEQPASAMKFFAAMASHMEPAQTARFLLHILAPVQRVLDEDTIADPSMDALKTLATEVQDLVQKQVGTTAFTEVYSRLRNKAMAVRRDRKEAKALMVATDPERAARRKAQHSEVKKESKKRKGREFREGRAGNVPFAKKSRRDF